MKFNFYIILYVNKENGIRFSVNKSRNDEVGDIIRFKPTSRGPATVDEFYSCDKPQYSKVVKLDPRVIE